MGIENNSNSIYMGNNRYIKEDLLIKAMLKYKNEQNQNNYINQGEYEHLEERKSK